MPLAVCFLAALTLADHLSAHFLHPSFGPSLEALVGKKSTFEADVLDPPEPDVPLARTVVSLEGTKILLLAEPPLPSGLERGDRIRFSARLKKPTHYRNPGGFDYRQFLERRGILLTGFVASGELDVIEKGTEHGGAVARAIDRVRTGIGELLATHVGGPEGGFLNALLSGNRYGLMPETWEDFRRTGTAHLVAISGQHIGMVGIASFAALFWLLKRSRRLLLSVSVRATALALTILPILFYTALAGAPPSAIRATVLSLLVVLALLSGRDLDPLSALATGAIVVPLLDPAAPFSASFQLSFLAVFGILLFRRAAGGAGPPTVFRKYLVDPLWMTLGATLATAPLVAYLFHSVSISGILTNLWAIPFSGLLLISGGVSIGLAGLVPPWASILLAPLGFLARLFLKLLHVSSEYSWVVSFYPTEAELFFWMTAVVLLAWLRQRPGSWRRVSVCGAALVIAAVLLVGVGPARLPKNEFTLTFFDVGEGDAALVTTPSGKCLLIDGGGFLIPGAVQRKGRFEVGREVVVPYLKRLGLKKIDAILLSHPHPDHYGGLRSVVEAFPVGEFWWSGQAFPDETFASLLESLDARAVPKRILKSGDRFSWDEGEAEILYPERVDRTLKINDNSIVLRLALGGVTILLPGDIEKEGERLLAQMPPPESTTILKIPHHGSRTSSSIPLIDWARPQYVVASLGEGNMFRFPHAGILERYENRGAKVFRTDRDGAVMFTWSRSFPGRAMTIQVAAEPR